MAKYTSIEEIFENESVIKVLNSAKLPGERNIFAELINSGEKLYEYRIYVCLEKEVNDNNLVYLGDVVKKEVNSVLNWYIKIKGF
jgi:hypothetical protein